MKQLHQRGVQNEQSSYKVIKMLKQKIIKRILPFIIIFSALFFAGFVSFSLANHQESKTKLFSSENKDVKGVTQTIVIPSSSPKTTPNTHISLVKTLAPTPLPKVLPTPTSSPLLKPVASSPVSNSTSNITPSSPVVPQTNLVDVSISGSSSFTVNVDNGSNQCDVLTKALQQGKISSLNMQYSNTYNTNAVYQINGIGKENQVWWTYSVNGTNPPLGCSYVKTKSGDKVVWTYTGPN